MIDICLLELHGELPSILGMRNSYDSRRKSDSGGFYIGPNDYSLMERLAKSGPSHAKYRRMIVAWIDILAPMYWWKEFDTYKVGTVANSQSTMHTITRKPFDISDFSVEHLTDDYKQIFEKHTIRALNNARENFLETKDKTWWWQIIQMLPSSYNQLRTVMLNYEVLANMYALRKDHKLDEWRIFCNWIEELPNSGLITGKERK